MLTCQISGTEFCSGECTESVKSAHAFFGVQSSEMSRGARSVEVLVGSSPHFETPHS